jgi:phosphate transport system protein
MPFGFLRSKDASERLENVETLVQRMLADDRHVFDLAMSTLVGGVDPGAVRREIKSTDHRVNEGEREVRRELVVHASVVGAIDTPAILIYMSIVKDIERIGDYAKNLLDLARDGASFAGRPRWVELASEISELITEVAEVFAERDADRARDILSRGDKMLDEFDAGVSRLVRGDDQDPDAVARALALRYLKRVVAHLTNVLSAVVMPIDRIDYFDEDPEDRD